MSIVIHSEGRGSDTGNLSEVCSYPFGLFRAGKPKAFVNHTAEMELSTIFTLPQVLLSRMTLLGMTNILILSFASIMTTLYLSVNLIHSFMYFCVPFLITSLGCLFILNHIHTKECNYYCGGWSIVIMCLLFALSRALPILYETSLAECWCLLFVMTLLGVLFECKMLIRNCQKDALNYLTAEGGY